MYCLFFLFLGYLNIFDLGRGFNLERGSITLINLHPNGHSFNATIIIFLLIICREKQKFKLERGIKFYLAVILLLSVIIINGTRGAFLISLVGLIYYYFKCNPVISIVRRSFITFIVFIPIFSNLPINLSSFSNNISSINRLTSQTNFRSDRVQQIIFSWNNFKKDILFGNVL